LCGVANPLDRIGDFSEQGRGLPIQASRPAPALPFSPLVRQAYAPSPRVRLGWPGGVLTVGQVALDPPHAVSRSSTLAEVAARMREDDSDYVPVVDGGSFVGSVYIEDLLKRVADDQTSGGIEKLVSSQIPTCAPGSALADAVRQMIACYLLRIPVVTDDGALVGMLTMATAAKESERDPTVMDLIETYLTPSFFARRWR
jgi:CBS domain-containing protein